MTSRTRKHPSPAMVVAAVALTFALAGSAVAGTDGLTRAITKSKVKTIANKQANKVLNGREASLNVNGAKTANSANTVAANGVDTAALQDNAVNSAKVADQTVAKDDVANNAIGNQEFSLISNIEDEIVDNTVGSADLQAFAVTDAVNSFNDATASDGNWAAGTTSATCPLGTARVAGGGAWGGAGADNLKRLANSFPSGGNAWQVTGSHDTGLNLGLFAYVICIGV